MQVGSSDLSRWVCPSCARRVPRNIAICRCGAGQPTAPPNFTPRASARLGMWETLGLLAACVALPLAIRNLRTPVEHPRAAVNLLPVASLDSSPPPAVPAPLPVRVEPTRPVSTVAFPEPQAQPWRQAPQMAQPPLTFPTPAPMPEYARTPPSTRSELDVKRAVGRQQLAGVLSVVASAGRELAKRVRSYRSCKGSCDHLLDGVGQLAMIVGKGIDEAEDIARRNWLDPGEVTDARKAAGLDSEYWDYIANIAREYSR
jgi:hypothetical protein